PISQDVVPNTNKSMDIQKALSNENLTELANVQEKIAATSAIESDKNIEVCENPNKPLNPAVLATIDKIIEKMMAVVNPNVQVDCNFYYLTEGTRFPEAAVIAISRNLTTGQAKYYSINRGD